MSEDKRRFLTDKICETIALNENFPLQEVQAAYEKLLSIDQLLDVIDGANDHSSGLIEALEQGLYVKDKVSEAIENALPKQASADRATVSLGFDLKFRK